MTATTMPKPEAHAPTCGHCGYGVTYTPDGWRAEDDTLGCADRPGELPHAPQWVQENGRRWYFGTDRCGRFTGRTTIDQGPQACQMPALHEGACK